MPAPRVLFVNHASKLAGAELVLLDLVRPWRGASAFLFEDGPLKGALTALGLYVDVSRWAEGVARVRRESSAWAALPIAGRLGAITAEIAQAARRHDVVYANSQKAFVVSAVATALVRRPLVWHLHDIIDATHFGAAQRRLQIALANRRATRVVVPSQAAADAFINAGGRRDLVDIVPNGIDVHLDEVPRARLRVEFGLPTGPLIGVFSRLAPWKGQHVVLEALTKAPDVRCVIAGGALFGEENYAAHLKALAASLGVADRVSFLGHRNDVVRLMQAVDIVVHPSVAPEPFGRTLVEAMLAKAPVIATRAGACADILDHGAAGALVPPGDSDALAAAILRVLADPDAMMPQIAYARARACEHYGVDRMLTAVSGLISQAAGARA